MTEWTSPWIPGQRWARESNSTFRITEDGYTIRITEDGKSIRITYRRPPSIWTPGWTPGTIWTKEQ